VRGKLRTITYIAVFAMLSPVGLVGQTALPATPVAAQAAVYDPGGQTRFRFAGETAPANLPPFGQESRAIYGNNVFSLNRQRVGDEAPSISPSSALLETMECQQISFNYSPSLLLCPPIDRSSRFKQGLDLGPSLRSGAAFTLDLRDFHSHLPGGVQPIPAEQMVSGPRWPADLDSKDYPSPAMARADTPGLNELHSPREKRDDMAFLKVAPQSGTGKNGVRDKVALVILSLAVHAAVTWDAQSTNHFFHHYPEGYRPAEADPLMRPFAGKALMYPMANLLFAAPFDLLLFKTRHSPKPIRILTYAAASVWVGMEIHQSIVNLGHEHIK